MFISTTTVYLLLHRTREYSYFLVPMPGATTVPILAAGGSVVVPRTLGSRWNCDKPIFSLLGITRHIELRQQQSTRITVVAAESMKLRFYSLWEDA